MAEKKFSLPLSLGALGVVFGDIGTSPLYALRETLRGLPVALPEILGVLSLIFWSLILLISIKYLVLVFRADNEGEGGILALFALLKQKKSKQEYIFYLFATFGAGLIVGDGMLTPAISITSAVEGLGIASAHFQTILEPFIVPASCLILVILFVMQSKGTEKIGRAFGPILLCWFIVIGALGLVQIIKMPKILNAMNPYYAISFLWNYGFKGYLLLGGVFLAVTGGEALYADMGHFGKNPIRISWFFVVLPGLVLNYFGQGAYLLQDPAAIVNPFYMLAPKMLFIPLVILATMATVIASQAVISATFSMTRQGVLLDLYPKLPIIQTSKKYLGQIYIPQVNFFLLIGTMILLFTFRSSSALSHAYGIAVNLDMLLVSTMVIYAARRVWGWSLLRIIASFSVFLLIDAAFLGANLHKFVTGGWVPVLFALFVSVLMFTWHSGMQYVRKYCYVQTEDVPKLMRQLRYKSVKQVPGTSIFITDPYDQTGSSFLHFLKLSSLVPENILLLNYEVANIPHVPKEQRISIKQVGDQIYRITLHAGFMDMISVPKALKLLNSKKLLSFEVNVDSALYLVEIPNIWASPVKRTMTFHWQEKLFAFLVRNYSANLNIEFYQLPYNRTIAIGSYFIV
ncbi:MAG: KUP/HAK/KT family potassium transporter [Legionella sp.]|nr:KUP/HAK/KT family potassium transporter [Legionella sp.]